MNANAKDADLLSDRTLLNTLYPRFLNVTISSPTGMNGVSNVAKVIPEIMNTRSALEP